MAKLGDEIVAVKELYVQGNVSDRSRLAKVLNCRPSNLSTNSVYLSLEIRERTGDLGTP